MQIVIQENSWKMLEILCLKKLCFTSDLDDLDFEASGLQGFEGICSRKVCVLCMFSTWNSRNQYSGQIGKSRGSVPNMP